MPLSEFANFQDALARAALGTERQMERLLPAGDGPEARLFEAMRYAALGPGRRLRPFFVYASATLFGVAATSAARVAAAVEFVHRYSRVHDDLPGMDDDDARRGRPSCHKRYDEPTAMLAGDALQSLAFEVLAQPETHGDPAVRAALVAGLAKAAGAQGLCGGQMMDIASDGVEMGSAAITRLHRLKTGALITFSCTAGAVLGKSAESPRHALQAFAHDLGLAYQIADDLQAADGAAVRASDPSAGQRRAAKASIVSVLGPERARAQARLLADQACQHLDLFAGKANLLKQAAAFVVGRST